MYRTHVIAFVLIACGLFTCQGAPQYQNSQNYGSERLLDLGSIFNRYPGYNQRPLYQQGGYGGYFPQGGYGGGPYGGGAYGGGGNPYGNGLGTNMLGNNFGGYGGYGGNGGLQSYMGYNNNNYSGQRNLGYGYYRNSDNYGFMPSPQPPFMMY